MRGLPADGLIEGVAEEARVELGDGIAQGEFNRGVRAYYFGLAAVFWFVDPWIFSAITTLIVAVLYRRDFRSTTLAAMQP